MGGQCTEKGDKDPDDPFRCPDGPLCELTKPPKPKNEETKHGWNFDQGCIESLVGLGFAGVTYAGDLTGIILGCGGEVPSGGLSTPGCLAAVLFHEPASVGFFASLGIALHECRR